MLNLVIQPIKMKSQVHLSGEAIILNINSKVELFCLEFLNLKKELTTKKNFKFDNSCITCFSKEKEKFFLHDQNLEPEICLMDTTNIKILKKIKFKESFKICSMIEHSNGKLFFSTKEKENESIDIWIIDELFEKYNKFIYINEIIESEKELKIDEFLITKNFIIFIENTLNFETNLYVVDLNTKKYLKKINFKSKKIVTIENLHISLDEKFLITNCSDDYVKLIDLNDEKKSDIISEDEKILFSNISNFYFAHETFKDNFFFIKIFDLKTQKLSKLLKFNEFCEFHFLENKKLICIFKDGKEKIIDLAPKLIIDFLMNRNYSCDIKFNYNK